MRRDTIEAFLRGVGGRYLRSAEGDRWEYQGRRKRVGVYLLRSHKLVFRYRWPR